MYDQRDQIHKNAKLNAGADNIDQLNDKAKNTTTGKELEARAKLHDAYLNFGQSILPIYTKAIEVATSALKISICGCSRTQHWQKCLEPGYLLSRPH